MTRPLTIMLCAGEPSGDALGGDLMAELRRLHPGVRLIGVGGPAMQSIVPLLIRDGELATAMALNSIPMTVGRILGPAAGAYLAAHLGPATAFTVSDTPSTVIDPLGAMKRCSGSGASTSIRCEPPSGVIDKTRPRPSTWPETT